LYIGRIKGLFELLNDLKRLFLWTRKCSYRPYEQHRGRQQQLSHGRVSPCLDYKVRKPSKNAPQSRYQAGASFEKWPQLAHRVISLRCEIWSLSAHSGLWQAVYT
jgi:hypothetical protein